MIPVIRHLPEAYSRPLSSELPKTGPLDTTQSQKTTNPEHIIEAEWRPISGSPARAAAVYQTSSALLTGEASPLNENQSPSLVAERYQQMDPRPNLQRGTLLDILA